MTRLTPSCLYKLPVRDVMGLLPGSTDGAIIDRVGGESNRLEPAREEEARSASKSKPRALAMADIQAERHAVGVGLPWNASI